MHAVIIIYIPGKYFEQTFRTPVGSLVSPILANLVTEDIENKAMTKFHHPPKVRKRYVDDAFVVKQECLQQFFNFLDSIESTVQFTQEIENDGVLAFMDVRLTCESTGFLDYTVHRKPTHPHRYLNFRSDHPLQHKKAAIGTQDAVFERVFTTNFMKFLTTFDEIFLTTIILTKHLVSVKSYNECYA